jgi:hypothetical protein
LALVAAREDHRLFPDLLPFSGAPLEEDPWGGPPEPAGEASTEEEQPAETNAKQRAFTMEDLVASHIPTLSAGRELNVENRRAAELASGPGEVAVIPFFKDITDQDDEIQVENTEPTVDNKITSGQMKAVACNRVCKRSATAVAAQLSGEDPVGEIVAQMTQRRLKQPQKTLLHGSSTTGPGASNRPHSWWRFPCRQG